MLGSKKALRMVRKGFLSIRRSRSLDHNAALDGATLRHREFQHVGSGAQGREVQDVALVHLDFLHRTARRIAEDHVGVVQGWSGPHQVQVVAGRAVKEIQVNQRDVVDLSALSAGSYMLEFTVPERGAIKRRIVVQ